MKAAVRQIWYQAPSIGSMMALVKSKEKLTKSRLRLIVKDVASGLGFMNIKLQKTIKKHMININNDK